MIFPDPIFEETVVRNNEARQNKFTDLKKNLLKTNAESLVAITRKYPNLPKALAVPMAMLGVNPDSSSVEAVANRFGNAQIDNESKAWEIASTDLEGNPRVPENQDMVFNFADALRGKEQLGIWALLGFESMGEKVRKINRQLQYVEDLYQYDNLLEKGYTSEEAQENIRMFVSNTEVPDIGKDKGMWGELKQYAQMWKESGKLAGKTAFAAAFREAMLGNPVNYKRDKPFLFESIIAEDDTRYHRLVDMGFSEAEARKIFYDNVGTPIKANEALGLQEYTSLTNPNQIQFFEGRKTDYTPGKTTFDEYLSISNWWRNKRGLDTGKLQPYSYGRAVTYNLQPSGTKAANVMSGLIDAGVQLASDIPLAKGIGALTRLKQASISVDKLQDAKQAGLVDDYLDTFKKGLDELEPSVDPFTGKNPRISGKNGQLVRIMRGEERQKFRAGRKLYKQAGVINGTRASLFSNSALDLLNSPFGRKLTRALTEENNVAKIMTTPGLNNLTYTQAKSIADATDYLSVRSILDDLFQTGKITQLPGKQSGLTNAVLRNAARKGNELLNKNNPIQKGMGRALSAIGNENAALRSVGSYLAGNSKQAFNFIKGQDTTSDIGQLFGFSATLRAGAKPYFNKILSVTPEQGLSFTDREHAVRNLIAHMQVTGYTFDEMKPIVDELIDIGEGDFEAIQKFAYEQIKRDELRAAKSGKRLPPTMIAKKIFESNADIRKYFIDSVTGENMPFVGDVVETIIERGPNGEKIEILVPSLHLLAESADLYAPLMDYRLINRAMGKVFTTYGDEFEGGLRASLKHTGKNISALFKGGEGYTGLVASKNLTDDAYTLTLDYMTRNLFKPLVLLRGAWFVRVFFEESMRMAVAGLDNMFIHPASHLVWARSHGHAGKLSKKFLGESAGGQDSAKLRESLEYADVTNSNWSAGALRGRPTSYGTMSRDFVEIRPGQEGYINAVGFELIQLRNDPVARYLAANGFNESSKAWFRSAEALPIRQELARIGGNKYKSLLTNQKDMDAYLASVEARIRIKTGEKLVEGKNYISGDKYSYKFGIDGGDSRLRQAIATGKLETVGGDVVDFIPDVSKEYSKKHLAKIYRALSGYVDDGLEFGLVKGHKTGGDVTGFLGNVEKRLDTMVEIGFKYLMTKPNAYLSRSVVFKQYYWQWTADNIANMTKETQKRFIREAVDAKIPKKVIDELKGIASAGSGKIDDYDLMSVQARAYGLSATKQLLYDASRKHLISDITRNIFPFPEVWFELAQTWSKLLIANPYRARQAQLAVTGARGSDALSYSEEGFFAPDPNGSGSEMFVYPLGGALTSAVYGKDSNVRIAPKGYVQGVNLLGQGFIPAPLPYVGVLADVVLPRHGIANEIRGLLYGEFGPPRPSDIIPLPAWLKKFTAAAGFGDESSQLRASTSIDVYRYGKLVGRDKALLEQGKLDKYINQGLTVDEAFRKYSKRQAGKIYLFRGLSQFVLPTGWTPRYYVEDKNGKYWGTQILADEYSKLVDENNNDTIKAFNIFVSKYGMEHGWLTAAKTQSKVGKQSYTDGVLEWQDKNKKILDLVPLSKYYVLPDSPYDERNYANMYDAFNKGDIQTLDIDEYGRQVNDTIGYFRYTAFKEQVEAAGLSSAEKTQILRIYRNYLIQELPGFQRDYGLISPVKAKVVLEEMQEKWLQNDVILSTESGKAFELFDPIWRQAGEISSEFSGTGNPEWWLTSTEDDARALRLGVAQIAKNITKQYPDFKYVWIGVYSRLFRDDTEIAGLFS